MEVTELCTSQLYNNCLPERRGHSWGRGWGGEVRGGVGVRVGGAKIYDSVFIQLSSSIGKTAYS